MGEGVRLGWSRGWSCDVHPSPPALGSRVQVSELVDVHMPQLKEGSATPADGGGGDGVGGVGSDGGEEAGSDGNESDGNEGRADSE